MIILTRKVVIYMYGAAVLSVLKHEGYPQAIDLALRLNMGTTAANLMLCWMGFEVGNIFDGEGE